MKIVEVNYTDLPGRIFNGYDLHLSLNQWGHRANQVVINKYSQDDTVIALKNDVLLERQLKNIESKFSMSNLLSVSGKQLQEEPCFLEADIVHYHILHNNMISLLDLPTLMKLKPSVWTIHDPWMVTGNCVHPLDCNKWLEGCSNCKNLNYKYFEMKYDKAWQMWNIKKQIYSKLDIDLVVATNFTKKYIQNSPLTKHINRIHIIPFGVDVEAFKKFNKQDIRHKYGIEDRNIVIGFRNDHSPVKGCTYIYKALETMNFNKDIIIISVGEGEIPSNLKEKFRMINLGWQNDDNIMKEFFTVCDIFIMPSLAESFGLMAIEAMAAATPVICFKDTVVEEVINAPKCGIAVAYKSEDELRQAIEKLVKNKEEREKRGKLSRDYVKQCYGYKNYVQKHVEVYVDLLERTKVKNLGR